MKITVLAKCGLTLLLIGTQLSCSSSDSTAPATTATAPIIIPQNMENGYFVMSYTRARFTEKDIETNNIESSGAVENPAQTNTIKTFSQFEEYAQIGHL